MGCILSTETSPNKTTTTTTAAAPAQSSDRRRLQQEQCETEAARRRGSIGFTNPLRSPSPLRAPSPSATQPPIHNRPPFAPPSASTARESSRLDDDGEADELQSAPGTPRSVAPLRPSLWPGAVSLLDHPPRRASDSTSAGVASSVAPLCGDLDAGSGTLSRPNGCGHHHNNQLHDSGWPRHEAGLGISDRTHAPSVRAIYGASQSHRLLSASAMRLAASSTTLGVSGDTAAVTTATTSGMAPRVGSVHNLSCDSALVANADADATNAAAAATASHPVVVGPTLLPTVVAAVDEDDTVVAPLPQAEAPPLHLSARSVRREEIGGVTAPPAPLPPVTASTSPAVRPSRPTFLRGRAAFGRLAASIEQSTSILPEVAAQPGPSLFGTWMMSDSGKRHARDDGIQRWLLAIQDPAAATHDDGHVKDDAIGEDAVRPSAPRDDWKALQPARP